MSKRLEIIEKMIAQNLEKGSQDPFPFYARAMELRSLNRLPEALEQFRNLEENFSKYVPTYLMAAQVASEVGDTTTSRRWTERGIVAAKNAGDDHAESELNSFLQTLPRD